MMPARDKITIADAARGAGPTGHELDARMLPSSLLFMGPLFHVLLNSSIYCGMRVLHDLPSAQIALDLHGATVRAIFHIRDTTLSMPTCSTLATGRGQKVSTCRSLQSSKQGLLDLHSSSVSLLRCTRRPTLICRATTRSKESTSHENLWRMLLELLNQQGSNVHKAQKPLSVTQEKGAHMHATEQRVALGAASYAQLWVGRQLR